MVTGSWNAICGMTMPAIEPSSPMFFSSRYSGSTATVSGKSRPAVNRP